MTKDIDALQGVWNVVSLEMDGSARSASGGQIAVKGTKFTSTGMGAEYKGTIEIDGKTTPKAFDLKFTTGPEKGNVNRGIYEIAGDTWKICLATRGPARPKKFASEAGTGIALEVLRRVGSKAAGSEVPPSPAEPPVATFDFGNVTFEPAPELAGEWSMISGTYEGEPLHKSFIKNGRRIVKGNEMIVTFGKEIYSKAKYTVDRSKSPVAVDIYNSHGAHAGKMQQGIYEIEGKRLRLSIAAPGAARPHDFSSTAGDGRTVVVWTPVAK